MLIISIHLETLYGAISYVLECHYQKRLLCQNGIYLKYDLENMLHFIKW